MSVEPAVAAVAGYLLSDQQPFALELSGIALVVAASAGATISRGPVELADRPHVVD